MKKIMIVLLFLLLLSGCGLEDKTSNHLREYLNQYCDEESRQYENLGILYENDIKNVGFYAIAKIEDNVEELVFLIQQIGTEKEPRGFNQIGPVFYDKNYHIFKNEDSEYGHGQNYYLYVVNNQISEAYYNGKALDIEMTKYTLNGENKIMSSWLIMLDGSEELNLDLLEYY